MNWYNLMFFLGIFLGSTMGFFIIVYLIFRIPDENKIIKTKINKDERS